MSESMWDSESVDDFALPGDDQRLQAAQEAEPAGQPDPVAEPEAPAAGQEEAAGTADVAAEAEADGGDEAQLIGGKFKSVDDLLHSYQELERDRGRIGNELGELRRMVEEQSYQQPQQVPFGYGPTDEQIDDQPAAIAEWALQQGDERTYTRALAAMYESGDPQLAMHATRLELARGTAPLYQELQTLKQSSGQQQADREIADWAKSHPDIGKYQARMIEIAAQNPDIQATLETGHPAAARLVLDHLYRIAASEAGPSPDNFAQAVRDAARDAQQEAAEAAVIQAGKAAAPAPQPKPADKLGQQWAEIEAVYDGWNI